MPSFKLGTNDIPSSREPIDLHPELQKRRVDLFALYKAKYPDASQPFLTQTYRNPEDQNTDFEKKPKVTNARAGQSLHNYYPSLAFDVAFIKSDGKTLDWNHSLFDNLGALAQSVDLNWGGSWTSFQDRPHFQPLNGGNIYSWHLAQEGREPVWGTYTQPVPATPPASPNEA